MIECDGTAYIFHYSTIFIFRQQKHPYDRGEIATVGRYSYP